jgi:hypothetical protein
MFLILLILHFSTRNHSASGSIGPGKEMGNDPFSFRWICYNFTQALTGKFHNSKLFAGDTPFKKAKKCLTWEKHSPNIHLTVEEAQIASSSKKAGKGKLAENITFEHNQRSLGGKDGR